MTTTQARPDVPAALHSALSAHTRPSHRGALSTSLTFAWRALLRIKHVPEQLFDVVAMPILFTLVLTYLLGGALAGSPRAYLQSLLPGILVQTVLYATTSTGSTLNADISKGVFDRFRSLPIWTPAVLVGALLGDAVRYTIASTVVVALGLALGFRPAGGALGVVFAVLLVLVFAFSLSWLWTLLGLLMRTPQAITQLSIIVLIPLTSASNIFVDPRTMPTWLQTIVRVNPVTHLVTAVRGLMHDTATATQIGWVLWSCHALISVFAPLAMYLYRHQR